MLSFTAKQSKLTNISFTLDKALTAPNASTGDKMRTSRSILVCPLSPCTNMTSFDYDRWVNKGEPPDYTSYAYIGMNVSPTVEKNEIKLYEIIRIIEGWGIDGKYGSSYYIEINETIPAGTAGWIPVKVHYEKYT